MNEELLRRYLSEAGIAVGEEALAKLIRFFEMLVDRNRVMNLTAITEPDAAARLHFTDSLMLLRYHPLETEAVIDVGTGAGFPGVPLKILCPGIRLTLLDAQQKRLGFLEEVVDVLALDQSGEVHLVHGRAEDAASAGKHRARVAEETGPLRERFDLALARAVAHLSVLSEYCLPFVRTGGKFVAYKAGEVAAELGEAQGAIRRLGGSVAGIQTYTLPGEGEGRSLIFLEKVTPTPDGYPRKAGIPAKKPLT